MFSQLFSITVSIKKLSINLALNLSLKENSTFQKLGHLFTILDKLRHITLDKILNSGENLNP